MQGVLIVFTVLINLAELLYENCEVQIIKEEEHDLSDCRVSDSDYVHHLRNVVHRNASTDASEAERGREETP